MRILTTHPAGSEPKLKRTQAGDERLTRLLREELDDAVGGRHWLDREFTDCLRRYDAVPKNPVRNVPVENAPNIEVALGAIAADSICAQFIDTIGSVAPLLTARPTQSNNEAAQTAATALQRRIDHGVKSEWNFRPTLDAAVLDDVQLGTAVVYVPFVQKTRKTAIKKVVERGAMMQAWPIEDVFVPGGSMAEVQTVRWIGLRSWYTPTELVETATARKDDNFAGWDISTFKQTALSSWVRQKREALGRQPSSRALRYVYEVFHLWIHFDYDEDGIDEDLFVVFDRASGTLGFVDYNTYDTRPLVAIRYQLRPYLFYGLGVLEMSREAQAAVSELMNQGLLAAQLANGGVVATKEGTVPDDLKLWVMKQIPCNDPTNDIVPKVLMQPHPATAQYIAMNMSLAERRVGVNEMSMPRPSQVLGARTPGITAMSLLQQTNRRFTPAFDQARFGFAAAVMQCLYREQERLILGDALLEQHLRTILGDVDGAEVIRLLKDPDFDQAVSVELTASSASVNKEADRQSALMLMQLLGTYYEKVLQLVQLAAVPQLPEPVREVAKQIAEVAGKAVERVLTTFDSVRDPHTFLLDIDNQIDALAPALDPGGLAGLAAIMGGQAQLPPPDGGDDGGGNPLAEAA